MCVLLVVLSHYSNAINQPSLSLVSSHRQQPLVIIDLDEQLLEEVVAERVNRSGRASMKMADTGSSSLGSTPPSPSGGLSGHSSSFCCSSRQPTWNQFDTYSTYWQQGRGWDR